MSARAEVYSGGSGGAALFVLLLIVGVLIMLGGAMGEALDALDGTTSAPAPPAALNDHAREKHVESVLPATEVFTRYERGQYVCCRTYLTALNGGQALWLYEYSDHANLMGGIFATPGGVTITSFAAPRSRWNNIICRDGYVLVGQSGQCDGWQAICP